MLEAIKLQQREIKVLVAQGTKIRRIGLQGGLKENGNIDIVGIADNAEKVFYYTKKLNPDIVIIDLIYMDKEGIETIYRLKELNSDVKVVVFSSGRDKNEVISALGAGANAYCLTNINSDLLAQIINTVYLGACWYDPSVANVIMSYFPKPKKISVIDDDFTIPLSAREKEVLKLIVQGKNNAAIAKELIVSVHTAKAHVCNILHKMNVEDRVQAAVKAINCNMV